MSHVSPNPSELRRASRGGTAGRRRRGSARPLVESLERRVVLSTSTWTGTNSNRWSDARNWDKPPAATGSDLVFPAGNNVTFLDNDINNLSVNSIALRQPYTITDKPIALGAGGITITGAGFSTLQVSSLSVATNTTISVAEGAGIDLQEGGILTGPGNLTKTGAGSVNFLSQGANNFAGAVTVGDGDITIGTSTALPNSTITVQSGATLTLDATRTATLGALVGSGTMKLGAASVLTVGNNNASTTFSGQIKGAGSLVKIGTGTFHLSPTAGLPNVYGGTTEVDGGSLKMEADNALPPTTAVTVGVSGKLEVNNHKLAIPSLTNSGKVTLGKGLLTITGTNETDYNAGSSLSIHIAGLSSGTQYGQLADLGGTVRLDNPQLQVSPDFSPSTGSQFTIVQAGAIVGQFSGLNDGGTFFAGGIQFRINYHRATSPATVMLTRLATTTTTTLVSSASSSAFGQAVTFTATVAPVAPATGTPTGSVTFKEGAAVLGAGALDASGKATLSTSSLGAGTHTITASYGGDSADSASSSTGLSQAVNPAPTSTAVVASANPSGLGQSVTFTATVVVVAPGAGAPTGSVTFKDGPAVLGAGALDASGKATLSTSALLAGPHVITALYGTDGNFSASASMAINQSVLAATTTALTSSANPVVFGQQVTFTATVAAGSGIPTGSVTFKDGPAVLGAGALDASGKATLSTSALLAGTHAITALYGGDSTFAGSSSINLTETVNARAPTRSPGDYDGDGKTDLGVYGYGRFAVVGSSGAALFRTYGGPADVPVVGDFDADGKTDVAVYGYGRFAIQLSSGGSLVVPLGGPADVPVVGDFFGDGKTDLGVYGYGRFAVVEPGTGRTLVKTIGGPADLPAVGDFDGDGKADLGVYGYGRFAVLKSGGGTFVRTFGGPADLPVVGDYDGDGKADLGVYGYGRFAVLESGGGTIVQPLGAPGDRPVVGDFDGDRKTDLGVFGGGVYTILKSGGGTLSRTIGGPSDAAVTTPAIFLISGVGGRNPGGLRVASEQSLGGGKATGGRARNAAQLADAHQFVDSGSSTDPIVLVPDLSADQGQPPTAATSRSRDRLIHRNFAQGPKQA